MTFLNEPKRIIVYSHDTFGLGNIRRMLAIAKSLVDGDQNVSVLILSGSPMLHAFRISPRIDYIKLPCLTRTMSGDYEAKSLNLAHNQILRMRSNLIRNSIIDFDPDLILVDKKPFGVADELANAFNDLKRLGHRAKLVLFGDDAGGGGATGGNGATAGAGQTGSGQAGSGQAGSGQAASGQAGSGQTGSGASTGAGMDCMWPAGPYGVGQGDTLPSGKSWQGYAAGSTQAGTVALADFYDCDGSRGINAVLFDTSQFG